MFLCLRLCGGLEFEFVYILFDKLRLVVSFKFCFVKVDNFYLEKKDFGEDIFCR